MPVSNRFSPGAHSFITSSGATLTYVVAGQGPRLLVNVAPGWGCGSPLYQNSFTFLQDCFTYLHLEVRGSRGSSFPDEPSHMSSWHMSEDIEALRIYLGLDAFDGLAGHSNGGCIALWYAVRHPTRVLNLVLLDTSVLGPDADAVGKPATKAILDARPDRDVVEAAGRFDIDKYETDEDFGKAMESILPLYVARPERDLARFKECMSNLPQIKCAKAHFPAEKAHSDQDGQLNLVRARVLIVVGREDFVCPVPVSELIRQRIAGATLSIVDDSGHLPWIEQPDIFERLLKSFYGLT
ncbi:alpha/beta-hydrolase [Auricularia subglabra TFB-10046 SS5]|nr:alpha/beta-hydrolase [Auricularia subglabra TFB-10046 SS5]